MEEECKKEKKNPGICKLWRMEKLLIYVALVEADMRGLKKGTGALFIGEKATIVSKTD